MDRRGEASHRGWSSSRGRGWRGRGRGGGGGGRPFSPPPSSTASSAAVNPAPAATVDDAAPIKGTCPDMCPAREREQRERLRDLAVLERVDGDPARTSPSLAVKKFCRTISSTNVMASDIRPLPVLRETMDYLLHLLDSSEHLFETIHDFIFDRTRSIRQDLSMQNIVNDQAVKIYEDVVTFHIRSHQRLARCCQDSDISSLCFLNMEQLTKCLLSLFDMYHVIRESDSHSKREAEYYSFYVLLHLGCKIPKMVDSLSLWYSRLNAQVRQSKEMVFARNLLRCYHLGNFKRFFCMIAAEATDLQSRLVEPFLNEVSPDEMARVAFSVEDITLSFYIGFLAFFLQGYFLFLIETCLVDKLKQLLIICVRVSTSIYPISLLKVRARALMYVNHSGYKLQHHPLEHLSGILMIEESELETLCGICGLEIRTSEGVKTFAPKQTSFSLPTSMPRSNGIYISREIER